MSARDARGPKDHEAHTLAHALLSLRLRDSPEK
jgi:hypothetical protein